MTREEEKFLEIVKNDAALGPGAARLIEDLFRAQDGLKRLSLTQRLRIVSLATLHNVPHVRFPTYQ